MKGVLISAFPPSKDNIGAPTALPYHLLKCAPEDIKIDLYYYSSYNNKFKNIIENDLNLVSTINRIVEIPKKNIFAQKLIKYRNKYNNFPGGVVNFPEDLRIIKEINNMDVDFVWLYPHWLVNWIPKIRCKNIIVTGPDSAVLHSERVIRFGKWNFNDVKSELKQLKRNIDLEQSLAQTNARMHFVGKADLEKYISISGIENGKDFFTLHPHYTYKTIKNTIDQIGKKRIIISGGGSSVYTDNLLDQIVSLLILHVDGLSNFYEFVLIGKNYEDIAANLKKAGFTVLEKTWVEDYSEELANAQIQIFPIVVGTGTKGKVLHAMATGLLGIGTEFAFENIHIDQSEDCILIKKPIDVIYALKQIINNTKYYQDVAKKGREKVLKYHSPRVVACDFWEKVLYNNGRL
jgi:hypothetical protein